MDYYYYCSEAYDGSCVSGTAMIGSATTVAMVDKLDAPVRMSSSDS